MSNNTIAQSASNGDDWSVSDGIHRFVGILADRYFLFPMAATVHVDLVKGLVKEMFNFSRILDLKNLHVWQSRSFPEYEVPSMAAIVQLEHPHLSAPRQSEEQFDIDLPTHGTKSCTVSVNIILLDERTGAKAGYLVSIESTFFASCVLLIIWDDDMHAHACQQAGADRLRRHPHPHLQAPHGKGAGEDSSGCNTHHALGKRGGDRRGEFTPTRTEKDKAKLLGN